ncbi:hypothetical protein [Nostoc sp. C110]
MPKAASYAPTVSLPLIMGAITCDGLRLGFPLRIKSDRSSSV